MSLLDQLERARRGELTEINVRNVPLRDSGTLAVLSEAVQINTTVTKIDLHGCGVGEEGVEAVADALHPKSSLSKLYLSANNLQDGGLGFLLGRIQKSGGFLVKINLSGNNISSQGGKMIADLIRQDGTLEWIDLQNNNLGCVGALAIAEALRENATLSQLCLKSNNISDKGATALARSLEGNNTVTVLDLRENEITSQGASTFEDSIRNNCSLLRISLAGNKDIDGELLKRIKMLVRANREPSQKTRDNQEQMVEPGPGSNSTPQKGPDSQEEKLESVEAEGIEDPESRVLAGVPHIVSAKEHKAKEEAETKFKEEGSKSERTTQRTTKDPPEAHVMIVGGGPVGLISALLLMEYGRRRHIRFQIRIYETRWVERDGKIRWCGRAERNNRRWQVVTIQSNVWSCLPPKVQEALFSEEENFVEMWPLGPDSPERQGYPRNIPVRVVEDKLLELLQDENYYGAAQPGISQPKPILCDGCKLDKEGLATIAFDFLILADGAASKTEQNLLPGTFGDRVPFPQDPKQELKEFVLGIFCNANSSDGFSFLLNEAESMALTVSQNRFLFNPLGRQVGFLNMWLTKEEADSVFGINSVTFRKHPCRQSGPCMFFHEDANVHGACGDSKKSKNCSTYFAPSLPFSGSPLMPRINDGLKLYGIPENCVKGFTLFQLGPFTQRTSFFAELGQYSQQADPMRVPYGFVLGDAAFPVSFRAGRGLNTGIKGALSLTRTLTRVVESGRWRDSDFVRHSGFMFGLQEREVRIRSLGMMQEKQDDNTYVSVVDKIKGGIETMKEEARVEFESRVLGAVKQVFTRQRLPPGILLPREEKLRMALSEATDETISTLFSAGPWNSAAVGGIESNPDESEEEPLAKVEKTEGV